MNDNNTYRKSSGMKSLGVLLKNISSKYKNENKSSITDILSSFSQMTSEYSEFTNTEDEVDYVYSNVEYSKCTDEEKEYFNNDVLQFIECLVLNSVYDMSGNIYNWCSIYKLMTDKRYKNVAKDKRKLIYSCTKNNRPIGESSYSSWNGFQIIDLDIKNAELSDKLKPLLFNDLNKNHWFLGVYKSASGKGLHIWTKIAPLSIEQQNKKTEYLCNFRHKYSYVYIVLLKYATKLGYTKEDIFRFMDMAMAKPQQGSFIAYDETAMMSTNFKNLRLDVNFESSLNTGIETVNWISHPDLTEIFRKLDWFANESYDMTSNVQMSEISNIEERDKKKSKGRKHYKHAQRWQLANTLVSLYGEKKAMAIFMEIAKDTPLGEIAADIRTASIHNKPISIWAIEELNNQHGFSIKIKSNPNQNKIDSIFDIRDESNVPLDPTRILNENAPSTIIHITKDQYLSDVKDDIMRNLSHITLLEAGAGYGKTEMIKAFKAKTLLILPFTSTIKAKVESSETTKDWLYFYGNKRPTLDDLFSENSMTMTIDKFSRLNLMELNQADFEFIVVDESHLLFTSKYRDVMSPAIQRLANCKAKVILMTGTPTGETLFFPSIPRIKIIKDDYRLKDFTVHFSYTKLEQFFNMCYQMHLDVAAGNKILFPTNKGNLFYETVRGFVQILLNNYKDKETGKPVPKKLRSFYYKKSNYGDASMDSINVEKSIADNDMILCSTYLSVGVDICDEYTFSVYFDDLWIPQDIEQFANRLRNNDLFIHMFLPSRDTEGGFIKYDYTRPLDLSFDETDLVFIQDLLKTLNDMLERNNEESKYSPIVSSISGQYPFFKYDENECKYYIDETTYKLHIFEDRYKDYSKQLGVLCDGMRYYGYNVIIDKSLQDSIMPEKGKQVLEDYRKQCRNAKHNENTTNTFDLLNHINDDNIEIYKEFLKGSYDIFRSPDFREDRIQHNLYVKDIEIINKNVPIILNLYKFYDIDTIRDIYRYCVNIKTNAINYSQLDRIQRFIRIESNRRKKRLDFPVQKFIKEATDYAKDNSETTVVAINNWVADRAAQYANSIKDVVVEDIKYFEHIYEILMTRLWKVVIIETKAGKGKIKIKPFELLWEEKNKMENIYGDAMTQTFFLQELMDNMDDSSDIDTVFDEQETEMPLPHTSKKRLADIKEEIPNIVHDGFEYDKYTKQDGSNERFLRKQENTNRLVDSLFNDTTKNETFDEAIKELDERTLFDD